MLISRPATVYQSGPDRWSVVFGDFATEAAARAGGSEPINVAHEAGVREGMRLILDRMRARGVGYAYAAAEIAAELEG